MDISLGFEKPIFLLALIILLPLVWYLGYQSLAGLGPIRRWIVLLFRTAVVTGLVFALAEIKWQESTDRLTVIYLLDQSESIPADKRELMLRYVAESVERHRRENKRDKAAVIVFGATAKIEAPPYDGSLPLTKRIESAVDLRTDATNIESAMKLAKAAFPEDTARRIVIISDGNQNYGDAISLAKSLAEDGVGIDVVPVDLLGQAEVSVDKVLIPADVRKGQKFETRIVVSNQPAAAGSDSPPVAGKLRLTRRINQREELVAEESVTLQPGKNVYSFPQSVDQSTVVSFDAVFVPDDAGMDRTDKNNKSSAFSHIRGQGRVLLIEDATFPGEFNYLVERLQAASIEVDLMSTNNLFTSSTELLQYDSIILANVPRSNADETGNTTGFSDAQVKMLVANCEEMGCGIVMLGGDRSFGAGGWSNSDLEKAMPVDFQIKNDKINAVGALALMMHASEMAEGNFWQSKIAKEAINVLGPLDYCGVVEWADMGGIPKWLWKLPSGMDRVESNRNRMLAFVGRMVPGDMPDFNAPMKLALNGLLNCDAAMKHMIIISDGDPTPPSKALLQQFKDAKIKISTVAVGTHGPANSRLLNDIADFTEGKYYEVKDPKALPRIYQREARRVAKPIIKTDEAGIAAVSLPAAQFHEALQGIQIDTMPPVFGYVMTTIKENPLVEQLVIANNPVSNPENATLLATWRYGVGRTIAFTTDAGHLWAKPWYNSAAYDKLFSQIVRYSMRPVTQNANFTIGADLRDGKVRVVVTALDADDNRLNFLNITGRGLTPDLSGFDLNLSQVAPGRYEGEFAAEKSGNYFFTLFPGEGYERLTAGISVPYSSEFTDRTTNLTLLESLSQFPAKGGSQGQIAAGPFNTESLEQALTLNPFRPDLKHAYSTQAMWPLMLVVTAAVFFTDIALRRVAIHFYWIPGLIRSALSRLRGAPVAAAQASIDRLKSRKKQVEAEMANQRAATRFAPDDEPGHKQTGAQHLKDVLESERQQEVSPPAPRSIVDVDKPQPGAMDENYTSRLLDAKRRAKKDKS